MRIFTEEHRKNLSEVMKGKKHSDKTRKKMSEKAKKRLKNKENHSMYGKYHTEETKEKMSENHACFSDENNPMYGKKHSKRSLKKMSEVKSGKNHPMYGKTGKLSHMWKGGISCEPYCDVWLDKEYKESIKERDNYECRNPFCLCNNSNLCIHHINYVKKDCKPDNLITLCKSSNTKANYNRWFWQEIYERRMKNGY